MPTDFTKQTYNKIAKLFTEKVDADRKIKILEKRITLGRGTQEDVSKLADLLGKHASDAMIEVFKGSIPDDQLFRATAEETIKPIMQNIHARINTAGTIEQALEDAKNGLKIAIKKGTDGAIDNLIFDVTNSKDYIKVLNNETITTARKFYDDFMVENVALRSELGYTEYIIREYDGVGLHDKHETCDYCKSRAGTFKYPDEANNAEVFARHPGCGCTIRHRTEAGTKIQQNWKNNEWV